MLLLESSIPHDERFQHMRNQRGGIDRFTVSLRMQRRIALQIGLQCALLAIKVPEAQPKNQLLSTLIHSC